MKLKKANAILALITTAVLIAHIGYNLIAYICYYYNPVLSLISGATLSGLFIMHGILAVIILIHSHDSFRIEYKSLNKRTVFQRITAAVIMVLLPLHALGFVLLSKSAGSVFYILLEAQRFVFYLAVLIHAALSFSNALVTLGLLADIKKKKILDLVLLIVAIIFGLGFAFYVSFMHLLLLGIIRL